MSDMLKIGADFLAEKQKEFVSQTVVYHRGAFTVSISATLGISMFEVFGEEGSQISVELQDFIFYASDLILNSSLTVPARGDYITLGTVTYKVSSGNTGQPIYSYSDRYNNRLRVHTVADGANN